jgi:hypothetical protein
MALSFFTITDQQTPTIGGVSYKYPQVNATQGYIDVVNTFAWKNQGANVDEVPAVILTEYELKYGLWTTNLLRLLTAANNASAGAQNQQAVDPYSSMYFGAKTGFSYSLPYLIKPGTTIRGANSNKWSQVNNPTATMVGQIPGIGGLLKGGVEQIGKGAELIGNIISPGYGEEPLYKYDGTTPKSINISFPLYNTVSLKNTIDNFSFISLLGLQTLKVRTTFLSFIPPKIYSLDSFGLGGFAIPAAYISNYDVQSIGTTRSIDIGAGNGIGNGSGVETNTGTALIPEAYKVNITLTELIPESANIMAGALGGNVVSVIGTPPKKNSAITASNNTFTPIVPIPKAPANSTIPR